MTDTDSPGETDNPTDTDRATTTAAAILDRVGPATVRIGRDRGRGAGVVIGEGAVVTNAHNLRGAQVTVTFGDGRRSVGDVTAVDPDGDLAVVAVDTAGVTVPTWAATPPALGARVWTVTATPWGGHRVTTGSVSAVGRPFRGPGGRVIPASVEHTAPLPRGSSGGPLVDDEGRLVGLNTHRLEDGFYLALPADTGLQQRIEALRQGQAPARRRLGVALVPAEAATRLREAVGLEARPGALVGDVDPDGPAARAGIRRGDLIVAAGGAPVTGPDGLVAALAGDAASLAVSVVRATEELDLEVHFTAG